MRHTLLKSLLAAGCTAALICASPALAQISGEVSLSLPSQDLSVSLRTVSLQTGRNIVAPSELVRGRQAPAISGGFTAEEAVRLLLAGSGLQARRVGDALVIFVAGGGESPGGETNAAGAPDGENNAIVVTGTNLRGTQPTSPLITLTRRDIDRTGATSAEQLMRIVPQNTQGGVNEENSGVTLPDQDVSDHGAGLNLRGLGQRATLVLLNGRRLAPGGAGGFVDISLIPVAALERVEILTDGASAIYGSDAVGGVVNFILRDSFDGFESALQLGIATQSGGEQLLASQTAGHDWQSGRAMLTYEYRLENEIRAGERPFTVNLRPDAFLFPRERKHSVLGTIEQQLAPGLTAGLTGTFAHRTTDRTTFVAASPLPIGVEAEAESLSLAGEVGYELSESWRVRLSGNYARFASDQRQTQPGGAELVNARDIRHAIFETGLKIDGALFDLPAGPVRLAFGGEARWENYREGFESSAIPRTVREASRNIQSAYGEILIPLFSSANRQAGLERLQLSAAGRYDRYSGTGSTFDPKFGLLWSPLPGLNLRASYGTSFRAPLLSEITGIYSGIYLPAALLYANPALAPAGNIALFLQGSNPELRSERSRTWTIGGDLSPRFLPGLTLTANYYSIRFSNRIALPTSLVAVIGNPAFASIVDLSPDAAAVAQLVSGAQTILDFSGPGFSNGGSTPADVDVVLDDRVANTAVTETSGIDLGLRYGFQVGASAFVLDANVTHIIAFDDQLTVTSPAVAALDRPYRPLDWRGRGGLSWTMRGWAGSLFVNHADGYRDDRRPIVTQIGAHTTFDAMLAYTFGQGDASWLRGTRIALFAENLFDNDPPRLVPDPGRTTGPGYDPVNASGRGRFLSVQVRRTW